MDREIGLGEVSIVTVGQRTFIGRLEGEVGEKSVMKEPIVMVEMVQMDPNTRQPVGAAMDLRKPCIATAVPPQIKLIPEIVQVLDNNDGKDALLIQSYQNAVNKYSLEDAGFTAPTPEDIRKANIGKA